MSQDRRFIELWLRRTRKELMISGRLAEITLLLQQRTSCDDPPRDWHQDLLGLLDGSWEPNMDDLITLDGVLARPKKANPAVDEPHWF
jgi:hypothetical protein